MDITERKKAEEALRESEERLRQAIRVSQSGIFDHDHLTDTIYWSPQQREIFGWGPDETVTLQAFLECIYPEDRERIVATVRRAHDPAGVGLFDVEYRIIHRGGAIRWLTTRSQTFFEGDGGRRRKVRTVGATLDISERKEAEEKIREKEGKYRLLFESANDGIFIHDETGFIDCNEKGAEMYGLPKEEIIGRRPSEFAPERQPDGRLSSEVASEKVQAALSGIPQVFEWKPVRADGSPFDVEITLSRLKLGGKMYLQAIVRDIGERKRLEQEMLKMEKLESLGTLAGGIAHDFNNLLQGIFGYISMAKMSFNQKEKSLAMLEQAENALHQSVSLTTQLLTFSKGGKPVKKQISLLPVIENAAKFALSGSQCYYQLDIEPGLWQVDADGGQLGQVIQNMVLNADHAMPEGGAVVITAKNVLKPDSKHPKLPKGNYVEISVQDRGIGIPKKYLQKIFDPYFTTKEKGSGLGLATSYSVIRNHGGLIDVTSESGKGTKFFIYLPAIEVEKEFKETTEVSSVVRKGKILVMDDDKLVRGVAEELIRTLGHEVDCAKDGIDAIQKFVLARDSGKPFDVVILDLTVKSGMGGEQTIKELREIDPSVKAIVSSGYSNSRAVVDYHSYGFAAFLNKPYSIDSLKNNLNALLR
ncbi:MAG TPA: PAS domain S-box protein [Syntrophorhabdaceae bacterium]|nr:PAS domain S-box protein [Syntrophorhabdaceae bacterium]